MDILLDIRESITPGVLGENIDWDDETSDAYFRKIVLTHADALLDHGSKLEKARQEVLDLERMSMHISGNLRNIVRYYDSILDEEDRKESPSVTYLSDSREEVVTVKYNETENKINISEVELTLPAYTKKDTDVEPK